MWEEVGEYFELFLYSWNIEDNIFARVLEIKTFFLVSYITLPVGYNILAWILNVRSYTFASSASAFGEKYYLIS